MAPTIIAMCECGGRLYVATAEAVFERQDDGTFVEQGFLPPQPEESTTRPVERGVAESIARYTAVRGEPPLVWHLPLNSWYRLLAEAGKSQAEVVLNPITIAGVPVVPSEIGT